MSSLHHVEVRAKAGRVEGVTVDEQEVRVNGIDVSAHVGEPTTVTLFMPAVSLLADFGNADVVALFDGLDPVEMADDVERALYGGNQPRVGEDTATRWRRLTDALALERRRKG